MIQTILIAAIILGAFFLQRKYYVEHWRDDLEVRVKFMNAEISELGE